MVSIKALTALAFVTLASAASIQTRQSGYADPKSFGGSSLGYFPGNSNGEPLNIIVTGIGAADTFSSWYKAIGYGKECFGLHDGGAMQAYIDSRSLRDQEGEIRFAYGEDPDAEGSCLESAIGGSHFRFWQQQGTQAWFLAASREKTIFDHHDIVADGYDLDRDAIVKAATKSSSYKGKKFIATVSYVSGLLPSGSDGINHGIALDGRTAVLSVTVS
ncbi:unnamed protein product [Tilletia laevis]|uniref:Chitosanase n=3 Tax=Tilletia TaxID=13289 RepID=A0A8X7SW69_9BASI|nr:hypothetical protein CF328_g5623 [Tilletia controversa]KAE8192220.1 hypothetical protein CF336_g4519 [Tilletia laevis]KAE8256088.1 hypothetical protein A4X03_0g5466 [Tilletia caries]KAE8245840.1 hypothetical protein A4X06_0g5382 [Tilletia controversa]CAD6891381.1 unnamed protein product [Tilletia caries]